MFEQYQKASRALPDKKEREEITLLKQKVCFAIAFLFGDLGSRLYER